MRIPTIPAVDPAEVRVYEDIDRPVLAADGRTWEFEDLGVRVPVVSGGSDLPTYNPLGPPVVSGDTITVDLLLNQPTRITTFLLDLTLARFVLDRLFDAPAGGVTGGAIVYDVLQANDLYSTRDVETIAPGTEFPIVTSVRRAPRVAQVEKYGGKFPTTIEAKDRNDASAFRNELIRLGNTIVRKNNQAAIAAVEDALALLGGAGEFVGNDWSAAIPPGYGGFDQVPSIPALTPGADFRQAQLLAAQEELGVTYDTALVNPSQLAELDAFYEDRLANMLANAGYREVFASNRIAVGTAYFIAARQAGQMRLEQPLMTETWYDQDEQTFWTQSAVRPVFAVTNPHAIKKATGL